MNHEVKNGFTPGPIESYRNARKISRSGSEEWSVLKNVKNQGVKFA